MSETFLKSFIGTARSSAVRLYVPFGSTCALKCTAINTVITEGEGAVAEAIARSGLEEFVYGPQAKEPATLLQPLGHCLQYFTSLKRMKVGALELERLPEHQIVASLQHPRLWKIQQLLFCVWGRDEELVEALSFYVQDNTFQRQLEIDGSRPAISDSLLAAIDSGSRCREEIIFDHETDIKRAFVAKAEPILALNWQRRLHGHLLKAPVSHMRSLLLMRALEAVDGIALSQFLRRNEWGLQTLLRQAAAPSITVSQPSRKRAADDQWKGTGGMDMPVGIQRTTC